MTYRLLYQRIRRSSRIVEHSEPHEHYDRLVVRKNEHLEPLEEVYTSAELYTILNNWFYYVEDGAEGCDRMEGHGWYFKLFIDIDGLMIDVTSTFLTHFDKQKGLLWEWTK